MSQTTSPTAPRMVSVLFLSSWLTSGSAYRPLIPAPISAGVFGMQRTSLRWPSSQRESASSRTPAAMLTTSLPRTEPASAAAAGRKSCGFTASTSVSAVCVAASGAVLARTPCRAASLSRAAGLTSTTEIQLASTPFLSSPPISALAMLPPPRKAILMPRSFPCCARRKSRCRCAPASRPRRWPIPCLATCPSTGCLARIHA